MSDDLPPFAAAVGRQIEKILRAKMKDIGVKMVLSLGFSAVIREHVNCFGTDPTIDKLNRLADEISSEAPENREAAIRCILTKRPMWTFSATAPVRAAVKIPDLNYQISPEAAVIYDTMIKMLGVGVQHPAIGRAVTFKLAFDSLIDLCKDQVGPTATAKVLREYARTAPTVAKMNEAAKRQPGHA